MMKNEMTQKKGLTTLFILLGAFIIAWLAVMLPILTIWELRKRNNPYPHVIREIASW